MILDIEKDEIILTIDRVLVESDIQFILLNMRSSRFEKVIIDINLPFNKVLENRQKIRMLLDIINVHKKSIEVSSESPEVQFWIIETMKKL